MKKTYLFVFLLLSGLLLASCFTATTPTSDDSEPTPRVYVAGSIQTSSGTQACYWKDGVRTDLEGANSNAIGIGLLNNHVYVVGYHNSSTACLWIDGVRQDLSGGMTATGIVFAGSTVIISGQTSAKACVWVNGVNSEVDKAYSYATALAVSNDTIYLAGAFLDIDSQNKAAIWTKPLSGETWTKHIIHTDSNYKSSAALAITVQNGTIWVSGYQKRTSDGNQYPFLWSGADLDSMSDQLLATPNPYNDDLFAHAYDIAVYNGQLYVAGFYTATIDSSHANRAALWNGTNDPVLYAPADGYDSAAFSVYVHNGTVYVAGNIEKPLAGDSVYVQPCYWKDGVRVELPAPQGGSDATNFDGPGAHAIIVQ